MTVAQCFAAFAAHSTGQALPAAVTQRVRACVADHLHAALLGAASPTGALLHDYLHHRGSQGPEATALRLGTLSAVDEIDDVHRDTSMHPGSVVVAAALGAAQEGRADDRRLVAAIAIGYEIAIRLSIAAGERHYHFFQSTATCGTIAAAAAAATVLGLDEAQTAHALGIAATSASGLWEDINDAAIGVKHWHSGLAAERGVRAAILARLGLAGPRQGIEGPKGFLAALAQPHKSYPAEQGLDPQDRDLILFQGLSEDWAILRNIFKRYPFCLGCFEPLEGLCQVIARSGRSPAAVDRVSIRLYPPTAELVGHRDPQDPLQAKFSAVFAAALVLAGHNPEQVRWPVAWLSDPEIRRWYRHIEILPDPGLRPRCADVTITWSDGTQELAREPLRTLSDDEVLTRFAGVSRDRLLARSHGLEEQVARLGSEADLAALLAMLSEGLQHSAETGRQR